VRRGRSVSKRASVARLVAVFVVFFSVSAAASVADAGFASSAHSYYAIAGINYRNHATIYTDHAGGHLADARSTAISQSGAVSAGWMGALPQRRSSTGALQCTGTWAYTSSATTTITAYGCSILNHSTYSSQGATRVWRNDGSGTYSTHGTFLSPNQNS